jgi:hypothetical protein
MIQLTVRGDWIQLTEDARMRISISSLAKELEPTCVVS